MIAIEQNTERQIQRLGAQRQLYATAKRVLGAQVILGGPIAVAVALLALVNPIFKGDSALWGITVVLCDIFWLTPWQKGLRDAAARVQEAFDCDVLELPWNDVKAGKCPGPELIKEQFMKYQVWAERMPPLANWYAPAVGDLPLHIGRLVCQRSNCWWDSQQRRRYAVWVIGTVSVTFFIVFWLSLRSGFLMEDFILRVAVPLAPALLLGLRQFHEQRETAARLDKLKEYSEHLWNDALSGRSEIEITIKSRALQDEILENRRRSPLVFDRIYKRLQRDYDVQMNHGVAEFVTDAKRRLAAQRKLEARRKLEAKRKLEAS